MQYINSVFFIDDEPMFNLINRKIMYITKFFDNVSCYNDGSIAINELLNLWNNNPSQFPHVIFLDIDMPLMDGWEFLKKLNNFPPFIIYDCRVFILTSSINPHDIAKANHFPIVKDFISKPLTVEKLNTLKAELLGILKS